MATLGDLERAVMERLWDATEPRTAYDLRDTLPGDPAVTTVLTVLSRLEKKGFVERERSLRPHRYVARDTRAAYMAELMHEVLGGTDDRAAVLERFVGEVGPDEAAVLRRLLGG